MSLDLLAGFGRKKEPQVSQEVVLMIYSFFVGAELLPLFGNVGSLSGHGGLSSRVRKNILTDVGVLRAFSRFDQHVLAI